MRNESRRTKAEAEALHPATARAIKRIYAAEALSQRSIARLFGLRQDTVGYVLRSAGLTGSRVASDARTMLADYQPEVLADYIIAGEEP